MRWSVSWKRRNSLLLMARALAKPWIQIKSVETAFIHITQATTTLADLQSGDSIVCVTLFVAVAALRIHLRDPRQWLSGVMSKGAGSDQQREIKAEPLASAKEGDPLLLFCFFHGKPKGEYSSSFGRGSFVGPLRFQLKQDALCNLIKMHSAP